MQIDFDKMGGLAPAIVQDADNGEVLMVGFMNQQALDKTLQTGFVTFYSRTRNKLWTKGETSGNRLRLTEAATDCDFDTVLCKVRVEGDGLVCHEGTRSCFTKPMSFTPAPSPSKTTAGSPEAPNPSKPTAGSPEAPEAGNV